MSGGGSFGELTPLLAPRSVAVVGASDREGNLGGLAVKFLGKFGYRGPVWPVNTGQTVVAGLPCFPNLRELPAPPDLAVVAVPAASVTAVIQDCIAAGIPAAVVWAGGFAEGDDAGRARQRELEAVSRAGGIKLCGPNCIGVINTAIGLTASFSSLMTEIDALMPGAISMVSQSGGTAVTAHGRAQQLGHGFRVTISCGNEATLSIGDFIHALVQDDGTRVIAAYAEGLADPDRFVDALSEAKRRGKPVVILKGGATEHSGKAALAHTGKLAGADRAFDAIFRECAAIRVHSTEELLDVALQLASLRPGQLPRGRRAWITTFGGGSGVLGTDQCVRAGLEVPPLDPATRERVAPIFPALGSSLNPIDLTPGAVTNPKSRATLPQVLKTIAEAPNVDIGLFFSSGFGALAPQVATMFEDLRGGTDKPICLSWLSPPAGITQRLAQKGIVVFEEHARVIRAAGHIARYAADLRHRIRHRPDRVMPFRWGDFVDAAAGKQVDLGKPRGAHPRGRRAFRSRKAASPAPPTRPCAPPTRSAIRSRSRGSRRRSRIARPPGWSGSRSRTTPASRRPTARSARAPPSSASRSTAPGSSTWSRAISSCWSRRSATAVRRHGRLRHGRRHDRDHRRRRVRARPDRRGRRLRSDRLPAHDRAAAGTAVRRTTQPGRGIPRAVLRLVAGAPWPSFTFEINPVKLGTELAAVDALLVID